MYRVLAIGLVVLGIVGLTTLGVVFLTPNDQKSDYEATGGSLAVKRAEIGDRPPDRSEGPLTRREDAIESSGHGVRVDIRDRVEDARLIVEKYLDIYGPYQYGRQKDVPAGLRDLSTAGHWKWLRENRPRPVRGVGERQTHVVHSQVDDTLGGDIGFLAFLAPQGTDIEDSFDVPVSLVDENGSFKVRSIAP